LAPPELCVRDIDLEHSSKIGKLQKGRDGIAKLSTEVANLTTQPDQPSTNMQVSRAVALR
jgi:hypothetical protein